jgi:two-component system OmpR family response regulator
MVQILIVDDEPEVRDVVSYEVQHQGWDVLEAGSGEELTKVLKSETPNLILLDIRLPDQDGLSIAQRLRTTSNIPIIMLTGLGSDVDRIVGLEMGADDYVVKPFNPRELIARIKAVLRRTSSEPTNGEPADALGHDCRRFAGWFIDLSARILKEPGGNTVSLTNAEFSLLEAFVNAPRCVLSRDQLLEKTHTYDAAVFDRTIDVLILRLRRKIEPNPQAPKLIRTERGAGYVLDADVEKG